MIHGVLLIHKQAGGTSHDIVHEIRRVLKQREVGHAGSLDPLAEGLMLILLGYGTKLSNYLLNGDKQYHFTLRLGITTDTLDKTGQIIEKKEVQLSKERIEEVLQQSQGRLSLPVPLVSAVKVKGKKLYHYKRANQAVTIPIRDMFFYDLEIKNIQKETAELILSCSKGGYVRSWVSFVGQKLGAGACLESLTRLKSAPFNVRSALTVQEVESRIKEDLLNNASSFENISPGKKVGKTVSNITSEQLHKVLKEAFIPFSQALPHLNAVRVLAQEPAQLRQGRIPGHLRERLLEEQKTVNKNKKNLIVRVMSHNNAKMLALLELKPFLSPKFLRVFPPDLL